MKKLKIKDRAAASEKTKSPWITAFEARTDLTAYGDNALGLFALALKFHTEDLVSVAAEAITDGNDDKKCDIVHIDKESGTAVIAQCYMSTKVRPAAPANKASDLNTAVNWLLLAELNSLPDRIRFSALELRAAITKGAISKIYVWYVHNCPGSKNVTEELKIVEQSAAAAIKSGFVEQQISVHATEIGSEQFESWYNETQSPILVNEEFKIPIDAGFEVRGPHWRSYVTSFPLQVLRREYLKHGVRLFSANVRDYLGSISSDNNINNGIKRTAESEPENFWSYNNGVTILVNNFTILTSTTGRMNIKFSGMSIVNGAQTTGALSSLASAPPPSAKVAVRLIQTNNQDILYSIIRYNNSQNKVAAADFRSTDQIQKRLKHDMTSIPQADYDGGRRGGPTDAIKRRPNLLSSYTVGQALAAMHGDATVAYNQKSEIWSKDSLYAKYFNEQTTAAHIVFAYGLLRAVEEKKNALIIASKRDGAGMTESQLKQLNFFRRRGSTFLFATAISKCLEIIVGRRIPNLFRLSFGSRISPLRAQSFWLEMVEVHVPLCTHLEEAFTYGLQNQEKLKGAVSTFMSLVEVTASTNKAVYKRFASNVLNI